MNTELISQNIIIIILTLLCFFLTVLDLAGNWWLMVVAVGFGFYENFQTYTPLFLLYLFIAFVIGETWEFIIGFFGIKRKDLPWSAVLLIGIGTIVGTILGTMVLPILGSVLGGALGGCAVAYWYEYQKSKDKENAKELAWVNFKIQIIAVLGKIVVGVLMTIMMIYKLKW